MEALIDPSVIQNWIDEARTWVLTEVLVAASLVQLAFVAAAYFIARFAAVPVRAGMDRLSARLRLNGWVAGAMDEAREMAFPIAWLTLQWLCLVVARGAKWEDRILSIAVSLLLAWVVIGFASRLIRDRGTARIVAFLAWSAAALNIVDLLDPLVTLLDSAAIHIGGFRLSIVVVLKGFLLFAFSLWVALLASRMIQHRLQAAAALTPSLRVLIFQLSKITLITIAVVIALVSVGIDLTAFAVFTGALGVGLGLGLQRVVGNLFSGFLLLIDQSIKPGDVIVVADSYGWVKTMGARYVSVITRDGTEHLIPNEQLISNRVENWSYSNDLVRLKVPIGISYKSDVRKAIDLILEAAGEIERVLKEPKSVCLMTAFGDSSVNLEARIWIRDPINGVTNVKSDLLLRVWDKFHENGIEIPFPQRDLHLRSPEIIRVSRGDGRAEA